MCADGSVVRVVGHDIVADSRDRMKRTMTMHTISPLTLLLLLLLLMMEFDGVTVILF
jgi:hypothetical protein